MIRPEIYNVMSIVCAFASFFALLQTMIHIFKGRTFARLCASGIFFVSAVSNLRFLINYSSHKTVIFYLDIPLALFLATFSYLFFMNAVMKRQPKQITIIGLLSICFFVLISVGIAHFFIFEPGNPPRSIFRALVFAFFTVLLNIAIFKSMKHLWNAIVYNLGQKEWAIHGLLFWFAALICTNLRTATTFLHVWAPSTAFYFEMAMVLGEILSIIYLYLIWAKYPDALHQLSNHIRKETGKYQKSSLASLDVDELGMRIKEAIDEKVFCDEDLSLSRLSEMVGATPHQLSEYINRNMACGFAKYINDLRIEEAILLMEEEPKRQLGSIASAVGFASESAFFRTFKNSKGLSPKQYLKVSSLI